MRAPGGRPETSAGSGGAHHATRPARERNKLSRVRLRSSATKPSSGSTMVTHHACLRGERGDPSCRARAPATVRGRRKRREMRRGPCATSRDLRLLCYVLRRPSDGAFHRGGLNERDVLEEEAPL